MIDLSILICSTHTRYTTFGPKIQAQVFEQYNALPPDYQARIEILMLTDNKKMMLGHKRNVMVDMAQGRYIQFVDDDDRIEPDMFTTVLDATDSDADVITFLAAVSINGDEPKPCHYSIQYRQDHNTDDGYQRLPNHICAVKRDLATQVSFPHVAHGEDAAYSVLIRPLLKTEHHIDRVLYHYDYSDDTTEAQDHLPQVIRRRAKQKALVDIVIMSSAKTPTLHKMTQHTIDTAIAGANSLPINVIVLEQQIGHIYRHADTTYAPEPFNYNAFANRGAAQGNAAWIMVANNDLIFSDGWLHRLLAADHPVVSPKCPGDPRQQDIIENTAGTINATHFSGWCYMLTRKLWQRLGGLNESQRFWCSDDVVIDQLTALNIEPMLVADAHVKHLVSATLNTQPNRDELTWGQVDEFNHRYGRDKFADDSRYHAWKQRTVPA